MYKFITLLLILSFSGPVFPEGKKEVNVVLNAASKSETDYLSATAFGMALTYSLSKEANLLTEPVGIYKPSFNVLVLAFSTHIQLWRELKEKDDLNSQYMDQLISVDDNGFLNEYVASMHSNNIIGDIPNNLQLVKFKKWSTNNLAGHSPRIEARLNLHE